jgi:hypothetical protein
LVVEVGGSSATLVTRDFGLNASGKINVRLDYIAGLQGFGEGSSTVTLKRGTSELWEKELSAPGSWTGLNKNLGPYARRGNYRVEFKIAGSTSSIVTVWLYVDNLMIRECATAVEPTSLGRVRALYR